MAFTFKPLPEIPDLVVIEPQAFADDRGWFLESYRKSEFKSNGLDFKIVQQSHSFSKRTGTLRGLHFQIQPGAQGKLVRCLAGSVYDVAVDVRPKSPTFRRWCAIELSSSNRKMLWIPPGFAHGFCALAENTEFEYLLTAEWDALLERSIIWNDKALGITWPTKTPILSEKDSKAPSFDQIFNLEANI